MQTRPRTAPSRQGTESTRKMSARTVRPLLVWATAFHEAAARRVREAACRAESEAVRKPRGLFGGGCGLPIGGRGYAAANRQKLAPREQGWESLLLLVIERMEPPAGLEPETTRKPPFAGWCTRLETASFAQRSLVAGLFDSTPVPLVHDALPVSSDPPMGSGGK